MSWKKLVAIGMLMMGAGATTVAWAWTAVAHSRQSGVSFLYYMAKSADEAETQALAGCERASDGCTLLGQSLDGPMTTVIVHGKTSTTRADHVDPNTAETQALTECRQRDIQCRLVSAAWDRGTHIMAVAIDHENVWVGPSRPDEAQARQRALELCRGASRRPEQCSLFHVLNGPGWVAVSRSVAATGIGLSVRSSEVAKRNALAECQTGDSGRVEAGVAIDCQEPLLFHNPSGTPEPATFRELVTRIRADKRAKTASVPPFLGRPGP